MKTIDKYAPSHIGRVCFGVRDKMELNENQKRAVSSPSGAMIVLAGPGSGKTTVIVNRIRYIIEKLNVPENKILVITFTKMAAEEMKRRYTGIKGQTSASFGTFHSCFFRIVRHEYGTNVGQVITDDERYKLIEEIIDKLKIEIENGKDDYIAGALADISLMKQELEAINEYIPVYCRKDELSAIYKSYEELKGQRNKIDFDDMLVKCYEILKNNENARRYWENRYDYILIDEFQDINKIQYECIKLIRRENKNIFVVGDDDQSIYKFRGSRPEFMLEFPVDFDAQRVVLDINYRSTEQIIKLCNIVISENTGRYEKNISGTGRNGKTPELIKSEDERVNALGIIKQIKKEKLELRDTAVIYRTNFQAMEFVNVCMEMNIPYVLKDKLPNIYNHWIAKDIFAYFDLAYNRNDNDAFFRIANKPSRYISKNLISNMREKLKQSSLGSVINIMLMGEGLKDYEFENIQTLSSQLHKLKKKSFNDGIKFILKTINYESYIYHYADYRGIKPDGLTEILNMFVESAGRFDTIEQFKQYITEFTHQLEEKGRTAGVNEDALTLTTMHSAKGLEFDTVFLSGAVEGIIPHERSISESELEEERRLFYVGITRAKNRLFISAYKKKGERNIDVTRFLDKVLKKKK